MGPAGGSGPAEKTTLAATATRALGWTFISNALSKLGTVGIGVVLARMLGPHAFGTYAVAWVALLAMLSLNDLSVSLAIVRWPGDPAEIAPTVTTIAVLGSIAMYAACFFGAPGYASAMGAPAAAGVIRVLALSVVLDGLVCTPVGLLDRHFRQDRRMIADQVNSWLGALVSIGLAWAGLGAMSLAVGRIAGAAAAAVLYITFSPEPLRFGFDRARARALLRYGTPLAGSTVVVFAVTNVDQLVVGRVLGATALGFYALALNLATWPVTIFSLPVRNVAPAAFARLQHDHAAMRSAFLSAAALLCAVALPVCLVIGGSATPLIMFAYGARWLPASRVLLWLSLLAALTIFFQLAYDYFVVLARTRVVFTVQLGWLLALHPRAHRRRPPRRNRRRRRGRGRGRRRRDPAVVPARAEGGGHPAAHAGRSPVASAGRCGGSGPRRGGHGAGDAERPGGARGQRRGGACRRRPACLPDAGRVHPAAAGPRRGGPPRKSRPSQAAPQSPQPPRHPGPVPGTRPGTLTPRIRQRQDQDCRLGRTPARWGLLAGPDAGQAKNYPWPGPPGGKAYVSSLLGRLGNQATRQPAVQAALRVASANMPRADGFNMIKRNRPA